ncbi:MAG: hypothetical protein K5881_03660 [Saccharofermentans sp.]|nr:hypothetical protein [Saccharofermentans sp.]
MTSKKLSRLWILYGAVFTAFICIGIFAGCHHEPWVDEAQSWLIARDNHTLADLLYAVKYEGTLPFWHLILKAFQLAGLDYGHIYIVPLLLTAAGVVILFFTDAPVVAKVMLPFSYFVIFQNAVSARTYAMVFPAMMLIVLFYKNRYKTPVRYHLSLFFLGMSSSYGVIIACSFMIWDFITILQGKTKADDIRKFKFAFYATGLIMALISILSLPPDDCSFGLYRISFAESATNALLYSIHNKIVQYVFLLAVVSLLVYYFRHCLVQFLVISMPLVLYMIFVYQRLWHMTYLFFLIASLMIIFRDEFKKTKSHKEEFGNLLTNAVVIFLLSVQCFTGFYSIWYDYRYQYSPAKEIAEIVKPYHEAGAVIAGPDFYSIVVSPYFDESIYINDYEGKTYFIWSNDVERDTYCGKVPDVVITASRKDDLEESGYRWELYESHMIYKLEDAEYSPYYVYFRE